MDIVTLKKAREQGLTRYFTGNPCKHGHVSERFTKCRSCCECKAGKNYLPQNKAARKRYAEQHPEQMKRYSQEWEKRNTDKRADRRKNPEYQKAQAAAAKKWADEHPEERKEKGRRYYRNHTDKVKAKKYAYIKANAARYAAHAANRRAMILQRTPLWLTPEDHVVIQEFYDEAARLTKETGVIYSVDHIVPLQGSNVSGLHVPWNLCILTKSDNSRKHNRFED